MSTVDLNRLGAVGPEIEIQDVISDVAEIRLKPGDNLMSITLNNGRVIDADISDATGMTVSISGSGNKSYSITLTD